MGKTARLAPITEWISFLLLVVAFFAMQILIGGTRMVFSLPSYAVLGLVGVVAIFSWRPKPAPNQWCLAIASIFFAYILARAWLSPVPYLTRSDIYSVLGGLVVYFCTACILTDGRQRMFFVSLLLLLALGHSLVGAIQFRDGNNFMPISWLKRYDYDIRASGFYVCPNHLAGLLEALGVLGLSMVCWSRWPVWAKLLVAYAVAICYVALVLTGSRGGYLSAGFGLVLFAILSLAILRTVRGRLFWTISGAGLVVALLLTLVVVVSVKRSSYLTHRAQNTFDVHNMRADLWRGALQQWKLEPIFGTGAGTYLYYGRFFRTERVQNDPIHAHNDYLHLLAEYGLVGALGMTLFLGAHLWHGMRNFIRLGPRRVAVSQLTPSNALALNVGALCAVASYLAHSVVDFNLHIPGNVLLMAFVFGLLANDGLVRETAPTKRLPSRWWWRVVLPLLGVALLVKCARLFPGEYYCERARTSVRDGRGAFGIMYAQRGLRHDPENPDLHYRLGQARMLLGSQMEDLEAAASFRQEGIEALQRARSIAPSDEVYALELASALDRAQRFQEAEWVYNDAVRLDPNSTSIRRYYDLHLQRWRRSGETEKNGAADNS